MKSSTLQQELSKRAAIIKKLAAEIIDLTTEDVERGRMESGILKSANSIFNNVVNIEAEIKKLK